MDYEEWSARFVEKDLIMPPVMSTTPTSADGEDRRERLKLKKQAMQESLRWSSNMHLSSDPDAKPVSRFVWRQYENCWSPERLNYALVCAERAAPPKLAGAVFAVGTPVHKKEEEHGVEVFQRDPGSSLWWQVYPTMEASPVGQPSSVKGRYEHTCCYYNGKIFMYGGRCGQKKKLFQDMACYDIATASWSILWTFRDGCAHPGRRCGHACTSNGSIMYIHGGRLTSEERYTDGACYTAKLVSFDMVTLTWKEIIPTYRHRETNAFVGEAPPESWMHMLRDRHSIEYVNGRIIMFGGRGPATFMVSIPTDRPDHEYFNGFFELNLSTKKCGRMVTTGYSPEGRELVASARCGRSILYCGGFNCRKGCFTDLFLLNTDTHDVTLVTPLGSGPGPRVSKMCAVGYSVMLLGGASKTSTIQCLRGGQYLADITECSTGHSDMFFLGAVPSLQQVCVLTIVSEGLDCSMLPPRLQHIVGSVETLS